MRKSALIILIATFHYVMSIGLTFVVAGSSTFDTGSALTFSDRALALLLRILLFPLVDPLARLLPSIPAFAEHILFLGNAALWGIVIVEIIYWAREKMR